MSTFEQIVKSNEQIEQEVIIEQETRRARSRGAVQQAMAASRVRPLNETQPEAVLSAIEKLSGIRLAVSVSGAQVVARDLLNNQTLSTTELVERALLSNADLRDARSTAHLENVHTVSELIKARSDCGTLQDKIRYIERYGLEAWEALPEKRPIKLPTTDPQEMGKAQYLAMSTEKRAAFVAKLYADYGMNKGSEIQGQILKRP